jgi:hypothetical protein
LKAISWVLMLVAASAGGLKSGPQVGEKPLPFTSNFVTGPQRGQQYCYVCQLKDEPALLAFSRGTDGASERLLKQIRDAVRQYRDRKLFGWMVLLGPTGTAAETALERAAYSMAEHASSTEVPVAALGDPAGPPGYRIAPEAHVTLLIFRSGKVLYNRAYTAKEWTPRAADEALKVLPSLLAPAEPLKP